MVWAESQEEIFAISLNPIQDGPFLGADGWESKKHPPPPLSLPFPKNSHK